jgi:hypothetical protein
MGKLVFYIEYFFTWEEIYEIDHALIQGYFKVNLNFFPDYLGTRKIKHFNGQLVAILHSLPDR